MREPGRTATAPGLRRLLLLALGTAWVVATASGARSSEVVAAAPSPARERTQAEDLTEACDGERDAAPALQAAYDARAEAGGGDVVIPPGRTCRLAGPVTVRSQVALRCAPGSRLVAAPAPGSEAPYRSAGAALSGSELRGVSVDDCTIVLGDRGRAIDFSGSDLQVRGIRILAEGERSDDGWMARVSCKTEGSCRFSDGFVHCSSGSGHGVELSAAKGGRGWIRDNEIRGCAQGIRAAGDVSVTGNVVQVEGRGSVGVALATSVPGADISGNEVRARGDAAVALSVAGSEISLQRNHAVVVGDGAVAFQVEGSNVRLLGNFHAIRGAGAIGYRITGSSVTIGSCTGRAGSDGVGGPGSGGEGRIHVSPVGANQLIVTGCSFLGGAYGVAQSGAVESANVTISSNRMIMLTKACIVATTGFVVTGNYCAWLASTARAVLLGDDRRPRAAIIHGVISDNIFQCMQCPALVAAPSIVGRCSSDPGRPCRKSHDCRSEEHPLGEACDPGRIESLVVSGNTLLGTVDGTGIDLGAAWDGDAASVSDVVLAGNQFTMRGHCTAIGFPADEVARGRIRDVEIGINSSTCPTYVSGFDERMGRIAPPG